MRRRREHPLFAGVAPDAPFYFVHSYAPVPAGPAHPDVALALTEHGREFVSAVASGNLVGLQFHPERSGRDGLVVLANFVSLASAGAS